MPSTLESMQLNAPRSAAQPAQALLAEELRCALHRLEAIPGTEEACKGLTLAYDSAVLLATGEHDRAWGLLTGAVRPVEAWEMPELYRNA